MCSPGERLFLFWHEKSSQLKNVHILSRSIDEPSGSWMQQGLFSVPFRKEPHRAELLISLHWMSYRCNCTLLSSSLQRCYINAVCFAFQSAALWKRRSVFVLGNVNSHWDRRKMQHACHLGQMGQMPTESPQLSMFDVCLCSCQTAELHLPFLSQGAS